ncbi:MAG: S9 family peptidase [Gammaproteobacteria bacterium]|nr:S9 family peptidase [Gammaproteobacteria bacterium]
MNKLLSTLTLTLLLITAPVRAFDINDWFGGELATPVRLSADGNWVIWVMEAQTATIVAQPVKDSSAANIHIKLAPGESLLGVDIYENQFLVYGVQQAAQYKLLQHDLNSGQQRLVAKGNGQLELIKSYQRRFPVWFRVDDQAFAFSPSKGVVQTTVALPQNTSLVLNAMDGPCVAIGRQGQVLQKVAEQWLPVTGISPIRKVLNDRFCESLWLLSEGDQNTISIWRSEYHATAEKFNFTLDKSVAQLDISDFRVAASGNLLGLIQFDDEYPRFENFQREYASLAVLIHKIDRLAAWKVVDSDDNQRRWLVEIQSPTRPPQVYLFDIRQQHATLLNERLPKQDWAKTHAWKIPQSGGFNLTAYITEPKAPSANMPIILRLHGGPFEVRERWRFDPEAQWLAAQGYLVVALNYRGSAGFGKAFQQVSFGKLRASLEDDVDSLMDALESHYRVRRENACLWGGSFGGFAALSELIENPKDYACGIVLSPVVDLSGIYDALTQVEDKQRFLERFGDPSEPKWRAENNLVTQLEAIQRPLLIIYSTADKQVPQAQYQALTSRLETLNKQVIVEQLSDAQHSLATPKARQRIYEVIANFLNEIKAAKK